MYVTTILYALHESSGLHDLSFKPPIPEWAATKWFAGNNVSVFWNDLDVLNNQLLLVGQTIVPTRFATS